MRSINDFKTSSVLWNYFSRLIVFNCVYIIIVSNMKWQGISGLTFWKCQLNNCNQVVNTSTHKWKHLIAASRLLHSSFFKLNWFDTTSVKASSIQTVEIKLNDPLGVNSSFQPFSTKTYPITNIYFTRNVEFRVPQAMALWRRIWFVSTWNWACWFAMQWRSYWSQFQQYYIQQWK